MTDYFDEYDKTREDPETDLSEDISNPEVEGESAGIYRYREIFITVAVAIALFVFCTTALDYDDKVGSVIHETEMISEMKVTVTGKDTEPETMQSEKKNSSEEMDPADTGQKNDTAEIAVRDNGADVSDSKWQETIFGSGESMTMTMQIRVQGLTENEKMLTGFRESDFIKRLSAFLSANNISTGKVTFSGPAACSAISGTAYEASLGGIKDRKLVVVFYPKYPGQYLFCLVKDVQEKEKTNTGNAQNNTQTQTQSQPQAPALQVQPQTTVSQNIQPETQSEYDAMRLSVQDVSGELSNYLANTYDLQYSLYDYLFRHGIKNAKTATVTGYYIDADERTASIELTVEGAGNITAIYDKNDNSYSFQ